MSEKTLEARLRAVDYALWAGNLLDPKYFDKASAAIKMKNKEEFKEICLEAGIPKDVTKAFTKAMACFDGDWGVW